MAALTVAALATAALLWSSSSDDNTILPDAQKRKQDIAGDGDVMQNYWTKEPFRPQHYGKKPFKTRRAVPQLTTQNLVLETESLNMNTTYAEFMRERIENTEWDSPPLSGERASHWPARERRRLPFFNHPGSEVSWIKITPASGQVDFTPVHNVGRDKI